MHRHDVTRDGESHAAPAFPRRVQRLEYLVGQLLSDAGAVVAEHDLADLLFPGRLDPDLGAPDTMQPLQRIGHQDMENPLQALGPHLDAEDAGARKFGHHLDLAILQHRSDQ